MIAFLGLIIFAVAGPAPSERAALVNEAELAELIDGNTDFALELFSELTAEEPEGNLFFSPFSVSTALAMTYAGAEGETARQMAHTLHYTLPEDRLHGAFSETLRRLDPAFREEMIYEEFEPLTLEIANAIWVERGFHLSRDYTELVESSYGARAENVDFSGDPEGSRIAINEWVADRTRDRILDLLPPGVIDTLTRVVLTNAVYFKGAWGNQFEEALTRDEDFTTLGGEVVRVPTMHQTERLAHCRARGCTAVRLPYSDWASSMLILLPDGDLGDFERSLDRETLEEITGRLTGGEVALSLPRFEFTSSFSLSETLESMGMTDAFGAEADFSGMTGDRDLYISAVIHKAFVKVDETGTEAAAATAVVMGLGCAATEPPFEIRIDRPFVFVLMDDITGSILFMGRVADPRG